MRTAYLLLGTNLGNRMENLDKCIILLRENQILVHKRSSIYETAAWGFEDQPAFYNQALEVTTKLSAQELLTTLKQIEHNMGRINSKRWKERLIDIDILYYDRLVENTENLIIPHPQLANRRFALVPINEISPAFVHPVLDKTNAELLILCPDQLEVKLVR
jgi:2-amino-4-hydroxy-6-hydroxymethyldihydropteridine diphosphokinase